MEPGVLLYHKRVAEYEEASSTLTYSMTPVVVEGSPKKKMRIHTPPQQKVEPFAAPSVSPVQQVPTMIAPTTPPQSSWKSIAIDELAMQQSNVLPFNSRHRILLLLITPVVYQ